MAAFPAIVAAALRREHVRGALLAEFLLASGPLRLWPGVGELTTLDGKSWRGAGEMGAVEGISSIRSGGAPKITFRLSGVSAHVVEVARAEAQSVQRSLAVVYLQLFAEDWSPLDQPLAFFTGVLDRASFEAEGENRVVSFSAESLFARRARPPYGAWTDADQQGRHPGDKGLQFVADQVNKTLTWPPSV